MASSTDSKPLSFACVNSPSHASPTVDPMVNGGGWRSGAYAEELLGDRLYAYAAARLGQRCLAVTLCVLPLAFALLGGALAALTLGA